MCSAIMLYDLWIVGRDEFGSLAEIAHWIAPIFHDVSDQPVCFSQSTFGLVDEIGLYALPAPRVAIAGRGIQLADVELVPPFGNAAQVALRVTLASAGCHLAVILRAESVLQVGAAAPTSRHSQHYDDRQYHNS